MMLAPTASGSSMRGRKTITTVAALLFTVAVPVWYLFTPLTWYTETPSSLEPDSVVQVTNAIDTPGDRLSTESKQHKQSCDKNCKVYTSRLDQYCHRSLLHPNASIVAEGVVRSRDLELVQVFITARHGDRSSATPYSAFKIGSPVFYQCGLVDGNTKWEGLKDFPKLSPLSSEAKNGLMELFPGMDSRQCGVGMLTQTGFQQHYALGLLIREKYSSFIGQDVIPGQLYVQSTDYSRTIRSAAAFLLGFLPNEPTLRHKVSIHLSKSPGIAGLLQQPPPGIKQTYGYCKKLAVIMQEDQVKTGYLSEERKNHHHMILRLCKMFSLPGSYRKQPVINELFDHIATRGCHNPGDPLPCNTQQECIDYSFASDLFAFSDWTWRHKYPHKFSTLAMLPFLRHTVVELMERAVAAQEDHYRFVFSFAHDSTLTQILNTLGIPIKRWMPYASRLVFELWRHKTQDSHFVRVLFNGRPITETLSTSSRTPMEVENQLLQFESWKSLITTGEYRDINTYNRMCGNH